MTCNDSNNCNNSLPNFEEFQTGRHRRRFFQPWYSAKADYNTNAKSYYDYLARFNAFLDCIVQAVNRTLNRNLTVSNTDCIHLTKTGDWVSDDASTDGYDDTINLQASVVLSTSDESLTLSNVSGSPFTLPNDIECKADGLYAKDFSPALNGVNSTIGTIDGEISELDSEVEALENAVNALNHVINLSVTQPVTIFSGNAAAGTTATFNQSVPVGTRLTVTIEFASGNYHQFSGTVTYDPSYTGRTTLDDIIGWKATSADANTQLRAYHVQFDDGITGGLQLTNQTDTQGAFDLLNGGAWDDYTPTAAITNIVANMAVDLTLSPT